MKATELPFDELMKTWGRLKERAGITDENGCICGQFGAPARHMCNQRYRLVQAQIDYETESFPPYPHTAA